MSTKLPIGDTINEAFQFGIHRWGSVLRFAWLPVVVSMVVILATALLIFDFSAFPAHDTELVSSEELNDILRFPASVAMTLGFAAYVVVFFLFSGVLASIYRLAALGEDRPGVFQLRMDGPAKRVFFAFVILALVNFIVWSVSVTIGLSITGSSWEEVLYGFRHIFEFTGVLDAGVALSGADQEAITSSLMAYGRSAFIGVIPMLYLNIKLIPFVAGSAAENRLWLVGSLVKTTGHFWSMIGIVILLFLALIVTSIVFQIIMAIVMVLAVSLMTQGSVLAIIGAVLFLLLIPASIWFSAFFYAVRLSLPAIIYRRLKAGA